MISFITVNYNNPQVTMELLQSLEPIKKADWEVIVVDNGSREDPGAVLLERFPWIVYLRSEHNLGFAGGNNLGIRHASGHYLFFINNDTELREDIATPLAETMARDPQIGIACPVIYHYDDTTRVQYAGFTAMHPVTGRNSCLQEVPGGKTVQLTHYPHGAAMMLSRNAIEKAGMMPEEYFLYYEEHDWAARVKKQGLKVVVHTGLKIYHKESMATGKIGELKVYFLTRNRILYMRWNAPHTTLVFFWLFFLLVALPKNLWAFLRQKDYANARAFVAGIRWNFAHGIASKQLGYKFNQLRTAA